MIGSLAILGLMRRLVLLFFGINDRAARSRARVLALADGVGSCRFLKSIFSPY